MCCIVGQRTDVILSERSESKDLPTRAERNRKGPSARLRLGRDDRGEVLRFGQNDDLSRG